MVKARTSVPSRVLPSEECTSNKYGKETETRCENVQEFEDGNMFLAYYSLGSLYVNTCFE